AELLRERRDYIEARLLLLDYAPEIVAAVDANQIALGVAQELALYDHAPTMRAHLQLALQGGATVALVRGWRKEANRFHALQQTGEDAPPAPVDPIPSAPTAPAFVCYFCGSAEYVETMEQIYIHKPCKALLKNALGDRFRDG